jgi:hypothetical protein
MTVKIFDLATYVILSLVGAYYLQVINSKQMRFNVASYVGPHFLPRILTFLLILFCSIGFVKAIVNPSKAKFEIKNMKYLLLGLASTLSFIGIWNLTELFYIPLFFLLFVLFTLFGLSASGIKKALLSSLIISLFTTGIQYFIFTYLFGIRLF